MTVANCVYHGDNLSILSKWKKTKVNLIYTDPPFQTGKIQRMRRTSDYGGVVHSDMSYNDNQGSLGAYLQWMRPRLEECYRVLADDGTMYLHLDYRSVHYVKIMLDDIFGIDCFLNEIIWAYDYGGRAKTRWSPKHDNILVYVKNIKNYTFNFDAMERIPYMAPDLVGPEKAARGKTLTDTWWHTIVPTQGKERTGYPNQKPLGIVRRIVEVSSNIGDVVLDLFAGSGTLGAAAIPLDRTILLIDGNPQAIEVMKQRLMPIADAHGVDLQWLTSL